jgi:hypothetical protein
LVGSRDGDSYSLFMGRRKKGISDVLIDWMGNSGHKECTSSVQGINPFALVFLLASFLHVG